MGESRYEHHAVVWNPYSNERTPNCYLRGHYRPLVGVQAVPRSHKILTADSGGVIKVRTTMDDER